jgi:hypothetical protein
MEKVKQAIESFIKGGDNSDTELLENILHKDYQNIQDGFFDKTGIFIIRKENILIWYGIRFLEEAPGNYLSFH